MRLKWWLTVWLFKVNWYNAIRNWGDREYRDLKEEGDPLHEVSRKQNRTSSDKKLDQEKSLPVCRDLWHGSISHTLILNTLPVFCGLLRIVRSKLDISCVLSGSCIHYTYPFHFHHYSNHLIVCRAFSSELTDQVCFGTENFVRTRLINIHKRGPANYSLLFIFYLFIKPRKATSLQTLMVLWGWILLIFTVVLPTGQNYHLKVKLIYVDKYFFLKNTSPQLL